MSGSPLRLVSDGNFSVNINNKNRNILTDLLLGNNHLHLHILIIILDEHGLKVTGKLQISDPNKRIIFSSNSDETMIGSDRVVLTSPAGVSVK